MIAVGWLEPGHPFATDGSLRPGFQRKLMTMFRKPFQPIVACGGHACGFCGFGRNGRVPVKLSDVTVEVGVSNLLVPGPQGVYLAPSMMVHYIREHGYVPPEAFQEAVLDSPRVNTPDYYRALGERNESLANGWRSTATRRQVNTPFI